jgi:hypothetical protein
MLSSRLLEAEFKNSRSREFKKYSLFKKRRYMQRPCASLTAPAVDRIARESIPVSVNEEGIFSAEGATGESVGVSAWPRVW